MELETVSSHPARVVSQEHLVGHWVYISFEWRLEDNRSG